MPISRLHIAKPLERKAEFNEAIVREKIGLLCYGVKANKVAEEIYLRQHPTKHRRTGNAGLHLILEGGIVANVLVGENYTEKSPYSLAESHILKDGKPVCKYETVPAPKWYQKKTSDGVRMADILLQEGRDTLITAAWSDCAYYASGMQCKFCNLTQEHSVKKPKQIAETAAAAIAENPSSVLHLTAGNTGSPDLGAKRYLEYVKAAKKECNIPISIEMSPPSGDWLNKLISAGVCGFSINIEVWNEERRKEVCPAKSRIPREEYFRTWQQGVELLGDFKMSSVLIIGLDSVDSIKHGIDELVAIGVKPVLIPFKPFKGAALNKTAPSPDDVLELSIYAAKALKGRGAKSCEMTGCERCGACTAEKDFLEMVQ